MVRKIAPTTRGYISRRFVQDGQDVSTSLPSSLRYAVTSVKARKSRVGRSSSRVEC